MQDAQLYHSARRRSITWRDRLGLSSLPLSTSDEAIDVAASERSYQGALPDVHEEVCANTSTSCIYMCAL